MSAPQFRKTSTSHDAKIATQNHLTAAQFTRKSFGNSSRKKRGTLHESTYNWYWLVDGLQSLKYPVVLANPAAMEQYSGIKHADDTNDAFFLAELVRLKILPTGYIYDPQLRPVRDLLRRRLTLVHQRKALMLSFKSLYTRTTGQEMTLSELKELEIAEAQELYTHPANQLIAGMQIQHIEQLSQSIKKIEKGVLDSA